MAYVDISDGAGELVPAAAVPGANITIAPYSSELLNLYLILLELMPEGPSPPRPGFLVPRLWEERLTGSASMPSQGNWAVPSWMLLFFGPTVGVAGSSPSGTRMDEV